jgi:hypothetical protein
LTARTLVSRAALLVALASVPAYATPGAGAVDPARTAETAASTEDLRANVAALASEAMRGRGAGSPELAKARDLLRDRFEAAGLSPGVDGGYLQPFDLPSGEKLANVVGRVRGGGDEWIVVGAHYDHLGMGEPGGEDAGKVHPGADDNASGVAALVRVARALAARTDLARTVYFAAFSGEEIGRRGSLWFVDHPPADLSKCAAMLNLDTVGRIEANRVIVFGTGTAAEWESVLSGVNLGFGFDLAYNAEGAGASDHVSFFAKGIPVLHFFSGAKPEYHRPGDRIELLNFDGLAKLADFVAELTSYLASSAEPLTYRPAGVERLAEAKSAKPRKVSFGSIPDFSRESGGILLSGVMPGSPAEAAGLAAGDLLVEMDGRAIDTIYDFQGVLAEHAPGDSIVVKYLRGGETREARVTLAERR